MIYCFVQQALRVLCGHFYCNKIDTKIISQDISYLSCVINQLKLNFQYLKIIKNKQRCEQKPHKKSLERINLYFHIFRNICLHGKLGFAAHLLRLSATLSKNRIKL